MYRKEIKTPYKPMLDSIDDTKHFDQDTCNLPIESPPLNASLLNKALSSEKADDDEFDGFTFEA